MDTFGEGFLSDFQNPEFGERHTGTETNRQRQTSRDRQTETDRYKEPEESETDRLSDVVFFHEFMKLFDDTASLRKLENRIEIMSDLSEVVFFRQPVTFLVDTTSLAEHEKQIKV